MRATKLTTRIRWRHGRNNHRPPRRRTKPAPTAAMIHGCHQPAAAPTADAEHWGCGFGDTVHATDQSPDGSLPSFDPPASASAARIASADSALSIPCPDPVASTEHVASGTKSSAPTESTPTRSPVASNTGPPLAPIATSAAKLTPDDVVVVTVASGSHRIGAPKLAPHAMSRSPGFGDSSASPANAANGRSISISARSAAEQSW